MWLYLQAPSRPVLYVSLTATKSFNVVGRKTCTVDITVQQPQPKLNARDAKQYTYSIRPCHMLHRMDTWCPYLVRS